MKLAVWSGPRNLSTAMMYAFGCRSDFAAWDEPFYAPYLARSGLDHPMRDKILQAHERDPKVVSDCIKGAVPGARPHWYMKHMPLHMDGMPLDWAEGCVHVHLIRHPARVVASYAAKRENPTLQDIGFAQQHALFQRYPGPVVDSFDIRANPAGLLGRLCAEIGLPFDDAMVTWPAGPKSFDGVWASHWYGAVHKSNGFAGGEGALPSLAGSSGALVTQALPFYEALRERKLQLPA